MTVLTDENLNRLIKLLPHWNAAIPHDPFPKQLAFLSLDHIEGPILFGGAAGPGKTDALLMAGLQYVDVPGYYGMLIRKTFSELEESLIARSLEWLKEIWDCPGAHYDGQRHKWIFDTEALGGPPGKSTLAFGYLDKRNDRFRYGSLEAQYIGFDEVTELFEEDVDFVCTRLRKPECQLHKAGFDPTCKLCAEYRYVRSIPLRIRAACNPVGPGLEWVKRWFGITREIDLETHKYKTDEKGHVVWIGKNPAMPFLPATLSDNKAISEEEYGKTLEGRDPVTAKKLRWGDWGAAAEGRYKREWFRRYTRQGSHIVLLPSERYAARTEAGNGEPTDKQVAIELSKCRLFMVADVAASAREGPGDRDIWANRQPSWTVVAVFLWAPPKYLLWWDNLRIQCEVPDVIQCGRFMFAKHDYAKAQRRNGKPVKQLRNPLSGLDEQVPELSYTAYQECFLRPESLTCDDRGLGKGIYQQWLDMGLPAKGILNPTLDKIVRSTPAQNMAKDGRIFLPRSIEAPWVEQLEDELFSWIGDPRQADDQVDVLSDAAVEAQDMSATSREEGTAVPGHGRVRSRL